MSAIPMRAWITYVCYPHAIVFTPPWKWPPRTFTECACACQKIRDGESGWQCHRCEGLWTDMLHATGWRPPRCPERPSIGDFVKAAAENRARALEAAINRFRDCGVEIERFTLEEHTNCTTVLCVDGIPRFTWRFDQEVKRC